MIDRIFAFAIHYNYDPTSFLINIACQNTTELKSLITKRIRNLLVGQIVRFLQTPSWICVILSFELLLLFLIIVGRELESNQQVNEHFPQDPHLDQSE